MLCADKFRIYPNASQRQFLWAQFGAVRFCWNKALALKDRWYQRYHASLSIIHDLKPLIARAKRSPKYSWLKLYDSMALQESLRNLQKTYGRFFDKKAGKPHFKTRNGRQSSYHCTCVSVGENWVKIPKMDPIRAKIHRPVTGEVKSITITYETTGEYYAAVLYDDGRPEPEPVKEVYEDEIVGVDVGLKNLTIDSNGNKTENPKPLRKAAQKTRRLKKSLSRKKIGSRRRSKARKRLARHERKVRNRREDHQHKVSKRIIDENQVVVAESLKITNMQKNHHLAGALADAALGGLLRKFAYKAKRKGKRFVQIGTFYPSSKLCSVCGEKLDELKLSTREWTCLKCGTHHDRDVNAAKNIRLEGIRQCRAAGLSVLRRAESAPTPQCSSRQCKTPAKPGLLSVKREASLNSARNWAGSSHGSITCRSEIWSKRQTTSVFVRRS